MDVPDYGNSLERLCSIVEAHSEASRQNDPFWPGIGSKIDSLQRRTTLLKLIQKAHADIGQIEQKKRNPIAHVLTALENGLSKQAWEEAQWTQALNNIGPNGIGILKLAGHFIQNEDGYASVSVEDLAALRKIEEKIRRIVPEVSKAEIDKDLKRLLLGLLEAMRSCIAEFSIHGPESIDEGLTLITAKMLRLQERLRNRSEAQGEVVSKVGEVTADLMRWTIKATANAGLTAVVKHFVELALVGAALTAGLQQLPDSRDDVRIDQILVHGLPPEIPLSSQTNSKMLDAELVEDTDPTQT